MSGVVWLLNDDSFLYSRHYMSRFETRCACHSPVGLHPAKALHFFFDSGQGSSIAFFYYIGSEEPSSLREHQGTRPAPDDHVFDATHVSWLVDSREELQQLRQRLESHGIEASPDTRHETIESIYFRDPNGYFLEVTIRVRPLTDADAIDAARTIEAAMQLEGERDANPEAFTSIDQVWRRKAALHHAAAGARV